MNVEHSQECFALNNTDYCFKGGLLKANNCLPEDVICALKK